jgi:hypothetical protein
MNNDALTTRFYGLTPSPNAFHTFRTRALCSGASKPIVGRLREHPGLFAVQFSMKKTRELTRLAFLSTLLALLVITIGGCSGLPGNLEGRSLQEPLEIELGKPGSQLGPVQLRSGQMIVPPRCCPPLELRDASGRTVHEFDVTGGAQPIVAAAGSYLLVGHDPGGKESVRRVEVKGK